MVHIERVCDDIGKQNVILLPLFRQFNEDEPKNHFLRIGHAEDVADPEEFEGQVNLALGGDDAGDSGYAVDEEETPI